MYRSFECAVCQSTRGPFVTINAGSTPFLSDGCKTMLKLDHIYINSPSFFLRTFLPRKQANWRSGLNSIHISNHICFCDLSRQNLYLVVRQRGGGGRDRGCYCAGDFDSQVKINQEIGRDSFGGKDVMCNVDERNETTSRKPEKITQAARAHLAYLTLRFGDFNHRMYQVVLLFCPVPLVQPRLEHLLPPVFQGPSRSRTNNGNNELQKRTRT